MVLDEWPLLLEPGIMHRLSKCIGEFPTNISIKFIGSVILEDDGVTRMVILTHLEGPLCYDFNMILVIFIC